MKILEDIQEQAWEKIFTRPFRVQRQEGPILQAAKLGMKDFLLAPTEKKGVYDWYVVILQLEELGNKVEQLFIDKNSFDKHLKVHREGVKEIISLFDTDLSKKSQKELGQIYQQFMNIYKGDFSKAYAVPFGLESYVIPRIKKRFREVFGKNSDEQWKIIEQPTELIEIQKIQIEISNLKLKNELEPLIPSLLKKYGWLTIYDFYDRPVDETFIRSLVADADNKEIALKIETMIKEIEENKKKLDSLLHSLKDEELKQALIAINTYVSFRAERMDNLRKILIVIKPFYERLTGILKEKDSKWAFDDAVNLTEREVEQVLLE